MMNYPRYLESLYDAFATNNSLSVSMNMLYKKFDINDFQDIMMSLIDGSDLLFRYYNKELNFHGCWYV